MAQILWGWCARARQDDRARLQVSVLGALASTALDVEPWLAGVKCNLREIRPTKAVDWRSTARAALYAGRNTA